MAERTHTRPGVELIADERARQVAVEGYTPEHDTDHDRSELVRGAQCYLDAALIAARAGETEAAVRRAYEREGAVPEDDIDFRRMLENPARHHFGWHTDPEQWPWPDAWNPSPDPVRNLIKAGALIAAEIDRLTGVRPAETGHHIEFNTDGGWCIEHPYACRAYGKSLLDCPVHRAASGDDGNPPLCAPGRYRLHLHSEHGLQIVLDEEAYGRG